MLGRTNITALAEGGIVTEVEDFRWVQMPSGVYGNFVKATCKDGRLVAITADGSVVHTADGEVWEASGTGFADCRLNDIEWDGSRFLIVGSCTEDGKKVGLILATDDFSRYERLDVGNSDDTEQEYDEEYYGIYYVDGRYLMVAMGTGGRSHPCVYAGDFGEGGMSRRYISLYYATGSKSCNVKGVSVAKNSSEMLLGVNYDTGVARKNEVVKVDGNGSAGIKCWDSDGSMHINVFECKDALYYESLYSSESYNLVKVLPSKEEMVMCTGQNFAFTDGVYFDGSQLFINSHGMLVVRKGEGIADKTVDDMMEIAPEMTMRCIEKAFGQLYIFGNHGAILRSSVETGNEEAIAVQAISARKALADAKAYADGLYQELEARIAALEAGA